MTAYLAALIFDSVEIEVGHALQDAIGQALTQLESVASCRQYATAIIGRGKRQRDRKRTVEAWRTAMDVQTTGDISGDIRPQVAEATTEDHAPAIDFYLDLTVAARDDIGYLLRTGHDGGHHHLRLG